MSADLPVAGCPSCGAISAPGARFCESCGATLGDVDASAPVAFVADADRGPISTPTIRRSAVQQTHVRPPCAACGGEVGDDLYCTTCGTKAPSERDHFREAPAAWVAGVCDRGIRHTRNEDAMALAAQDEPGSHAALVVCDGVSSSTDSDRASLAAARASLEVLGPAMPHGLGVEDSAEAAATAVLTKAAAAANAAVIAHTDPSSPSPASCTWVAAVVAGDKVRYAGIGDSRAYLLPDGEDGVQLTVDDSVAQAFIDAGMPRAQAESGPGSHTIVKWLGLDAKDIVPRVGSVEVTGPGWLLVCSDGLWNYASEPAALHARVDELGSTDPAEVALALVRWANAQGGHDNITVALARVGKNAKDSDVREDHG